MIPHSSGEDKLLFCAQPLFPGPSGASPTGATTCSVEPRAGRPGRSHTFLAMVSGGLLVPGCPLQQTPSSHLSQASSDCSDAPGQSSNIKLPKHFDQLPRSSVTQVKSACASISYFSNNSHALITYLKLSASYCQYSIRKATGG